MSDRPGREPDGSPSARRTAQSLLLEGIEALDARRPEAALAFLQEATRLSPEDGDGWNQLGRALNNVRRLPEAREALDRAVRLLPDSAEAWNNLGHVCRSLGDMEQACGAFNRAVSLRPESGRMLANLASAELALGDEEKGIAHFRHASELCPAHAGIQAQLGDALQGLGRLTEAETAYGRALENDPRNAPALAGLGALQMKLARYRDAERGLRSAVELQPDDPVAVSLLAQCLEMQGQPQRVLDLLQSRTWRQAPDWAVSSVARQLFRLARKDEAREILMRADLAPMERRSRAAALNTLGRIHEDDGDFEKAFSTYTAANQARGIRFDAAEYRRTVDRLIDFFSRDRLRGLRGLSKNESERPVFIVGMPRSGTSLVEQILGCHSAVHPCGERNEIFRLPRRLSGGSPAERWPECLAECDPQVLADAAVDYLSNAGCPERGTLRITDKLPANFLNLGLIEALFPRARVIYCRRDPLDTGLSCYQQDFNNEGMDFARNLEHIGLYQLGCRRLMAHWQSVSGLAIQPVDYEELVTRTEPVVRGLVSFLGLAWEDACLDYHRSDRVVRTASMDQVRQPIYRSSIGRWKNYAPWLGPLQAVLEAGWPGGGRSAETDTPTQAPGG